MIRGFRVRCPAVRRPGNTKPAVGRAWALSRISVRADTSIVRVCEISIRLGGLAAFSGDGKTLLDPLQTDLPTEDLQGFEDPG